MMNTFKNRVSASGVAKRPKSDCRFRASNEELHRSQSNQNETNTRQPNQIAERRDRKDCKRTHSYEESMPLSCTNRNLKLSIHAVCSPHPDKAAKGGEDAFFFTESALGVFDGVGGWADTGIDPSLYSRKLAQLTGHYVRSKGPGVTADALRYAVAKNNEIGSCTACVIGLQGRHLVGANVGDSGLLVIRDGEIAFETRVQQHEFNRPYQLGPESNDTVDDGEQFDFKVRSGDFIVAATDGLWDNVPRDLILSTLLQIIKKVHKSNDVNYVSCRASRKARNVAQSLVVLAKNLAGCQYWNSPFSQSARRAGINIVGGKMDDVTVIVAMVKDKDNNG